MKKWDPVLNGMNRMVELITDLRKLVEELREENAALASRPAPECPDDCINRVGRHCVTGNDNHCIRRSTAGDFYKPKAPEAVP